MKSNNTVVKNPLRRIGFSEITPPKSPVARAKRAAALSTAVLTGRLSPEEALRIIKQE